MNVLSQTIIKYSRLFVQGINENDVRIFLESSPQYPNLLSVVQTLQYANLHVQVGQCDWDYFIIIYYYWCDKFRKITSISLIFNHLQAFCDFLI